MGKIEAIKALRNSVDGLSLKDAKEIVERIEPLLQDSQVVRELRTENDRLRRAEQCAKGDLTALIRLVTYFVRHPQEYEEWMREHQTRIQP